MDVDEWQLNQARDLDQLRDRLEDVACDIWENDNYAALNKFQSHMIDKLPTFGGEPPGETASLLSWDASRALVTDDLDMRPGSLRIARREEFE